jgi:hypothetical protein
MLAELFKKKYRKSIRLAAASSLYQEGEERGDTEMSKDTSGGKYNNRRDPPTANDCREGNNDQQGGKAAIEKIRQG